MTQLLWLYGSHWGGAAGLYVCEGLVVVEYYFSDFAIIGFNFSRHSAALWLHDGSDISVIYWYGPNDATAYVIAPAWYIFELKSPISVCRYADGVIEMARVLWFRGPLPAHNLLAIEGFSVACGWD